MKKRVSRPLALFLAMLMLLMASAGCGRGGQPALKDGATLQTVVDAVRQEFGEDYVKMPTPLDEDSLRKLYGVEPADVEEFVGDFALSMTSADNFVAVRAKSGRSEAVRKGLENRRAQLEQVFEQYLPDPLETARAGRVVVKGDYVFLVMLGDPEKGASDETDRAVRIIDGFFNS